MPPVTPPRTVLAGATEGGGMNGQAEGTVGRGEALVLTQPSLRRRHYELWRGERVVGRLGFPPGRRSLAMAEGEATGALALIARRGGVEVRGGPDAAATIAVVERARRGAAVIRTVQGPLFGWRRDGRWHRWAIDHGGVTVLRFAGAQGLLRSSVRITVERPLPEPTLVLLCLVGGFLALHRLQDEVDGGVAVAGIVAAG
jgi:hypothetical protein